MTWFANNEGLGLGGGLRFNSTISQKELIFFCEKTTVLAEKVFHPAA